MVINHNLKYGISKDEFNDATKNMELMKMFEELRGCHPCMDNQDCKPHEEQKIKIKTKMKEVYGHDVHEKR